MRKKGEMRGRARREIRNEGKERREDRSWVVHEDRRIRRTVKG